MHACHLYISMAHHVLIIGTINELAFRTNLGKEGEAFIVGGLALFTSKDLTLFLPFWNLKVDELRGSVGFNLLMKAVSNTSTLTTKTMFMITNVASTYKADIFLFRSNFITTGLLGSVWQV